jgi:hypothetical protein
MKIRRLGFLAIGGLFILLTPKVSGQIKFKDVTKKAGLIEPLKGMMGHGVAWGDVNKDGYPDLFFGTFAHREDSVYNKRGHSGGPEPDKLFINHGGRYFTEIKDTPVRQWGMNSGAAFADFDNDGDLDLVNGHLQLISPSQFDKIPVHIFENVDGKGTFRDVTEDHVLAIFIACRNTFVFDFDGDGLLDILLQDDAVSRGSGGQRKDEDIGSVLLKNLGDLKFKKVNEAAGISGGLYGLGGFTGDINNDGWPDFFFGHSSRMFINNGDGTFHEKNYDFIEQEKTLSYPNNDWSCGADIGDLDGDGDFDLVIGNHFAQGGKIWIFRNEGNDGKGDPVFTDITEEAGIDSIGKQPHVEIQDFNNDGLMDILIVDQDGLIYVNNGVKNGIPRFSGPEGVSRAGGIYLVSCPAVDYDRDGRLDLLGAQWYAWAPSPLLRNVTRGASHYINVAMDFGTHPNRNGIGARVSIYEPGRSGDPDALLGVKIISVSFGYSSGQEAMVHFGIPDHKEVDILVSMPCGGAQLKASAVPRDQTFTFSSRDLEQ